MSAATMTKKDGLRVGAILSGILTVPEADFGKIRLSDVGDIVEIGRVRPGDQHGIAYRNHHNRPGEHFDGAGVRTRIPDLGCGRQVAVMFTGRHNAFVNQGLQRALDSMFNGLTAVRITHIGLSADAQAVTATTTSADPAGGATGTSIKTTANVSRTNQTVHADQTWTQADVNFAIRKIFQSTAATATDVTNIIGGSGGASPYNEDFTIDLTLIATWSLTMGIDTTMTAS